MSLKGKLVYEFGPFHLDPSEFRLLRDGRPVMLTPKAFETLLALTENAGHVVEKDELMKRVWPDTIVEESTIAQNIFTLRKVLGAGTNGIPYIETVPKHGYRLAVPVRKFWEETPGQSAEPDGGAFAGSNGSKAATVLSDAGAAVVTTSDLDVDDLTETRQATDSVFADRTRFDDLVQRRWWVRAVVLIVVLAVAAGLYFRAKEQRRMEVLIAAFDAAANNGEFETIDAKLRVAGLEPADPRLAPIASRIAGSLSVETRPSASVHARRLRLGPQPSTADLLDLGSTPVRDRSLIAGEYVIDLTAPGALPMRVLVHVQAGGRVRIERALAPMADGRAGMVLVKEGDVRFGDGATRVAAFLIDSHEVTNAEFQRFVSAGKYNDAALWPGTMLVDGHEIPRAQALARFVDRTGLSGPRTWSNSSYPEGKADHPVVGVSWYEASAYARWAGKELPTFEQWWRAAMDDRVSGFPWGQEVKTAELRANFGLAGTSAAGAYPGGLSPFGCTDMAGNAREWLRNEAGGSLHAAVGASWLEPAHDFERVEWFDAAQDNPGIGFRLVAPVAGDADSHKTAALLPPPGGHPGRASDDAWIRHPVDDRTFESFSTFFAYDRPVPFDLKVVETKTDRGITVERLIFQSSPGIRVPALLLRGADSAGRPGVVLLHSAGAKGKDLPNNVSLGMLLARAGWSVIAIDLPYFGERATDLLTAFSDDEKHRRLYNQPAVYLGWMTQTVRDVGRAFDLLIERTHADAGRVALVGASRGAMAAAVAAGVDRRFGPVVLLFGGHSTPFELDHLAAACPANFIARIAPRPLLMLNSVNDQTMLRGSSVQPLFNLAGQPKDIIWTHGGHMVMTESDVASVLSWLRRQIE